MKNKMWDYIDEQTEVLNRILNEEEKTLSFLPASDVSSIILTASGSSLNAAMLVKTLIEKHTNKTIIVENPMQLRYYSSLLETDQNKKMLIALSQTGKSTGTMDCIQLAKEHQIETLAITADPTSPIAKLADKHIDMMCHEESVGPKTKGFTATVLTLHLVLLKIIGLSSKEIVTEYRQSILELPENIQQAKTWCKQHHDWALAKAMSVVGFGVNYPTAREGTLKILETMQIPVMNFDLEEFMHGPHRTIVKDSYLILIDTTQTGHTLMDNFISFVRTKTEKLLVISNLENSHDVFKVGAYPLTSSWLNIVIFFQVMCTYMPEVNGINSSDPIYGDFATKVGTRIA